MKIEIRNRSGDRVLWTGDALDIRGADFREADLRGADFREADLQWVNFSDVDLRGADFREADLSGADFHEATLIGADFRKATLRGADFREADLRRVNFRETDLRWINFGEADLSGAYLMGADLRGADLHFAYLRGANLHCADLSRAYLMGAYLRGANLRGLVLTGADLTWATGLPQAPVVPDLDRKMAEVTAPEGALLDMGATTHCRAGWAVLLAGPAGAALEERVGSLVAGALIYHESTGKIPDFFVSSAEARADIVECAAPRATALTGHGAERGRPRRASAAGDTS